MPGPVLLYGAGHSFFTVILGCLRPVRRFPRANGRRAQRKGVQRQRHAQQHGRCERSRLRRIQKSSHILNARKMRMITQLKRQRRRTVGKADAYQRQRRMQRAAGPPCGSSPPRAASRPKGPKPGWQGSSSPRRSLQKIPLCAPFPRRRKDCTVTAPQWYK